MAVALMVAPPSWGQEAAEAVASFGDEGAQQRLWIKGATDIPFIAPALQAFVEAWPEFHVTFKSWNSNDLYRSAVTDCRGNGPVADLLISSSVDQQVKLVNDGCAQPYRSPATAALPNNANWRDELFGVTSEPVVMVYNRDAGAGRRGAGSRFDLLDLLRREGERYAGRVATYDIEASGVGYLFAFLDSQQATTFGGADRGLRRARTRSRPAARRRSSTGWRAADISSLTTCSAPMRLPGRPRTRTLPWSRPRTTPSCSRRAVMIPKGAANPAAAGLLIDFLLSDAGRAALVEQYLTVDGEAVDDLPRRRSRYARSAFRPSLLVGLDARSARGSSHLWRAIFPRR